MKEQVLPSEEFTDERCYAAGQDVIEFSNNLPEGVDACGINLQCSECDSSYHNGQENQTQAEVSEAYLTNIDQDNYLNDLKTVVKLQESGISLEYRCPTCRSCSKCKNAPDTDRISLREEAECAAIRDSVKVDFNEKKIMCTIPLRGREEDFLSNN